MNDDRSVPVRMNPDAIDFVASSDGEDDDVSAQLERERKRRNFREEGWFYRVRIVAIGLCAVIAALVVITYSLHLILPKDWAWLTEKQITRIENFAAMVVVGIVGTLSASYFLKK